MTIHISGFWEGVIIAPILYALAAWLLHHAILRAKWLKHNIKGHPVVQWPALWCVCWGLPKLTKDYCLFEKRNDRWWFSPRAEKFRILPRPEDQGE